MSSASNPPQFVSKYTQQLIQQQQMDLGKVTAGLGSTSSAQMLRSSSQSSISSGSSHATSMYSSNTNTVSESNYASGGVQATFNPYQTKASNLPPQQTLMESKLTFNGMGFGAHMDGNNETVMSGGEAFQAFLSKNDGGDDEDDE